MSPTDELIPHLPARVPESLPYTAYAMRYTCRLNNHYGELHTPAQGSLKCSFAVAF